MSARILVPSRSVRVWSWSKTIGTGKGRQPGRFWWPAGSLTVLGVAGGPVGRTASRGLTSTDPTRIEAMVWIVREMDGETSYNTLEKVDNGVG